MLTLPIPFSIAVLAVGRRVDATNVLGLVLLLIFTHGVRLLHYNLRVPIVLSITISAACYCIVGSALARVVPGNSTAFWIAVVFALVLAVIFYRYSVDSEEEGHRSPCPVWIKLPVVASVVIGLVIIKMSLHGFTTVFPMVGVIAAYEARKCLRTISRQIPVVMITMIPLMVVCRLAQPTLGPILALAIGWVVFLAALYPFTGDIRSSD
jgi:hypothetical protein